MRDMWIGHPRCTLVAAVRSNTWRRRALAVILEGILCLLVVVMDVRGIVAGGGRKRHGIAKRLGVLSARSVHVAAVDFLQRLLRCAGLAAQRAQRSRGRHRQALRGRQHCDLRAVEPRALAAKHARQVELDVPPLLDARLGLRSAIVRVVSLEQPHLHKDRSAAVD
jgi:hypothetical protein